jgi:DNA repair protein RadA/Sms
VASVAPSSAALRLSEIAADAARGAPTGIGELDQVLGEGLVPGGVVLLAGEPGVGKSTLLLEVASRWAQAGRTTLYVTAEESAAQVRRRARRIGAEAPGVYLAAETDLAAVLGHIEQLRPGLVIVDSVQTIGVPGADGAPGGVTQVKEVAQALIRVAKQRDLPMLLVGHVTKDGSVAGPRALEHLVDVVLAFEGDKHSELRLLRATKNRFGPADEIGCFELTQDGIVEVPDPSGLFVSSHAEPAPGSCLTVTLEGRRPLLTEVQALAAPSFTPAVKRASHGLDLSRVLMLLAVLGRRAGVPLANKDVYVSTVGGAKISDPAADLALAVGVASAVREQALSAPLVAFGEVGLSGEIRRVGGIERRLAEAARLGFTLALVPPGQAADFESMRVVEVATLSDALSALGLRSGRAASRANAGRSGGRPSDADEALGGLESRGGQARLSVLRVETDLDAVEDVADLDAEPIFDARFGADDLQLDQFDVAVQGAG